jgi:hypothetical protein
MVLNGTTLERGQLIPPILCTSQSCKRIFFYDFAKFYLSIGIF